MESRGNWLQTSRGVKFHVEDPRPEEILIEDIAHSLALQNRFCGHTKQAGWSVAQHSMLVVEIMKARGEKSPDVLLAGLLHDASEAYVSDIPAPVKSLPGMEGFRTLEERIQNVIANKWSLPFPWPDAVEDADVSALVMEARDFLAPLVPGWAHTPDKYFTLPNPLVVLPWNRAENLFLDFFGALQRERFGDDWALYETPAPTGSLKDSVIGPAVSAPAAPEGPPATAPNPLATVPRNNLLQAVELARQMKMSSRGDTE